MQLKCNLCEKYVTDRHVLKTDILWLRTIRGTDYLVCKLHRGGYHEESAIRGNRNGVQEDERRADQHLLPGEAA